MVDGRDHRFNFAIHVYLRKTQINFPQNLYSCGNLYYTFSTGNNILNDGLPPIDFIGGSSSNYSSSDHEPASIQIENFNILADEKTSGTRNSVIWFLHNEAAEFGHRLEWATETEVCEHVKRVLRDVIYESTDTITQCHYVFCSMCHCLNPRNLTFGWFVNLAYRLGS